MPIQRGLFDGMDGEQVAQVQRHLHHRRFDAGAVVIAQGDILRWVYVIESGIAELLVTDAAGKQQSLRQVGRGEAFGEVSLLTGEPAAATLRAVSELDVVVVEQASLRELAAAFPIIYQNLSSMIAARIAAASFAFSARPGRTAIALDEGAPPLLGYAPASSLAWHTRRSTLLIVAADTMPAQLEGFSDEVGVHAAGTHPDEPRARIVGVRPDDSLLSDVTSGRSSHLTDRFGHVLVWSVEPLSASAESIRFLAAAGAGGRPSPSRQRSRSPAAYTLLGWQPAGARIGPEPDRVLAVPPTPTARRGAAAQRAARRALACRAGPGLGGSRPGGTQGGHRAGRRRGSRLRSRGRPGGTQARRADGRLRGGHKHRGGGRRNVLTGLHGRGDDRRLATARQHHRVRLAFPTAALLSSARLRAGVRAELGDLLIEDMPIPFAATAADLVSGQEVTLGEGPLWRAVMAAMSIPGIFPPQPAGDQLLVDGGVVDMVPSRVASAMGADVVIAVRLPDLTHRPMPSNRTPRSVVRVLRRSLEMMRTRVATESAGGATILIQPDLQFPVGLRHFAEGWRFVEVGDARPAPHCPGSPACCHGSTAARTARRSRFRCGCPNCKRPRPGQALLHAITAALALIKNCRNNLMQIADNPNTASAHIATMPRSIPRGSTDGGRSRVKGICGGCDGAGHWWDRRPWRRGDGELAGGGLAGRRPHPGARA